MSQSLFRLKSHTYLSSLFGRIQRSQLCLMCLIINLTILNSRFMAGHSGSHITGMPILLLLLSISRSCDQHNLLPFVIYGSFLICPILQQIKGISSHKCIYGQILLYPSWSKRVYYTQIHHFNQTRED